MRGGKKQENVKLLGLRQSTNILLSGKNMTNKFKCSKTKNQPGTSAGCAVLRVVEFVRITGGGHGGSP